MVKDGIKDIVGKTISKVIVAEKDKTPNRQIFLIFSDNTHFEIYGEKFTGAGGVDRGGSEAAIQYAEDMGGKITDVYEKQIYPQTSHIKKTKNMKNIIWISVLLLLGYFYVNSYIDNKAKRNAVQAEEKRKEQAIKSLVKDLVNRTNAITSWEKTLSNGTSFRVAPILTVELEKLWLTERPIQFIGTINDISTYDNKRYKILLDRNSLFSINNLYSTDLQLSLLAPKRKIDAFLKKHPKLFKNFNFTNGVVVVAKINDIRTKHISTKDGSDKEIRVGHGKLVDMLFIEDIHL